MTDVALVTGAAYATGQCLVGPKLRKSMAPNIRKAVDLNVSLHGVCPVVNIKAGCDITLTGDTCNQRPGAAEKVVASNGIIIFLWEMVGTCVGYLKRGAGSFFLNKPEKGAILFRLELKLWV